MTEARERSKANAVEAMWKESERHYYEERREERRAEWYGFHLAQAERIERTAAELAASHRAKAAELLGREEAYDAAS